LESQRRSYQACSVALRSRSAADIEKKILLRALRKRVWRALSDSTEFGIWFGVKFDGPFAPDACMRGVIVPTTVDAEVANAVNASRPRRNTKVGAELVLRRISL
jgi:hypothetical protein